jgi:hypothetical protein
MKYELVLQWPSTSKVGFEEMIKIEDTLTHALGSHSEVEGHEWGAGEFDIFIDTDDPMEAFKKIKQVLQGSDAWADLRVAYRDEAEPEYTIIWPENLKYFNLA